MLSKCIDSRYLVGATPLTVFLQLLWNFADVFSLFSFWMEWRCACEMLSKCIDSGYLVSATPLTVFFWLFWNFADVLCMEWRCACGFGIIRDYFVSLFLLCELSLFFDMKCYQSVWTVGILWAQLLLQFSFSCFEILQMFSEWNEVVHVVLV